MMLTDAVHIFPWDSMTQNNCNTYLIDGPSPILIDPGHLNLFEHVQRSLLDMGRSATSISLVICTHGHPDHVEGARVFHDAGVPAVLHRAEWDRLPAYQSMSAVRLDAFTPSFHLEEGPFAWGGRRFEVIHTPGHTEGSISLYWPEAKVLLTGDVIFAEGVGRTDLPGGSGRKLKSSIRRLAALDVEWLLPGHGGVVQGRAAVKQTFEEAESFWFAYI